MTTPSLYQYRSQAQYVRNQVAANSRKLRHTWAKRPTIMALAQYVQQRIRDRHDPFQRKARFGLCHGTRRGKEQWWFREALPGCVVIGTEIAPTATRFANTIQWDFHEVAPEWVGQADFVYSNSFDHAHDPERALNAWVSCLRRPAGVCLIEFGGVRDDQSPHGSRTDPFVVSAETLPGQIAAWGGDRYRLLEVFPSPGVPVAPGVELRHVAAVVPLW